MSYNSDKGYVAERAVELLWNGRERPVMRPRAGAVKDIGDLVGLPIVQSVKNHRALDLAGWVTGMLQQTENAGLDVGVVWHKRRGYGHPYDWYVTTNGAMAVQLIEAYCDRLTTQ
jgi:hypothetical protein